MKTNVEWRKSVLAICILAFTNSNVLGEKNKKTNGIYIYLTHSYAQTQYQVVE